MVSRTPVNGNSSAGHGAASSMREAIGVLFRHKRKMAVFFCTTMALVVVGLLFCPRTYVSDARLFVRIGRESVGLDPTATVQETVSLNDSRESEINSEVEILRGRVLLEDVVDKLGADDVLYASTGARAAGWIDTLLTPVDIARKWFNGDVSLNERAVRKLEKSIRVNSPRRSNIIILTAKGRNPKQAQRILQAFVDAYMVRHAKANRTDGSYQFFVDQSKLLADQLKQVNEELRDAKNEVGLASLDGQRETIEGQANTIESAILENQRALANANARVAALEQSLKALPATLLAEETDGLPNQAADAMRNELFRLQIAEQEASSRFTSLHPTVIALRRQVAEARKILDTQQHSRSKVTRVSPVHQQVQTELMAARALASSLQAEADSLAQQDKAIHEKVRSLNDNEFRIAELTRRAELLETSYRDYVNNREQARIDQALALGRISNVNVVQPATYIAKPASPRVLLTLAAGFLLASVGSVLLAFVCERFDSSLKSPQQIENELGIPVLLSVPRSHRPALSSN